MACSNQTLNGIGVPCEGSVGGIVEVYIAPWADDIYTYDTSSASTGEVTAVNSAVTWSVYHFRKNSSNFSSQLTVDAANGVNFVETTVNLVFSRMDTVKRVEMNALALADMAVIVKDSNGKRWCLGLSEPVNASTGSGESGTAKTDGNRYSISLVDSSANFVPALAENVVLKTNED